MKILITTDWYKPVVNGVVTSVISLTKGLEQLGHEVRILTISRNMRSYEQDYVTYIGSIGVGRIYPNARMIMAMTHRYVKNLIEWKPDIVHSQCEFSTFFLAKKIAERCDAPLVHTYHTVYEDYTHYFSPNVRFGKFMAAEFTRRVLAETQSVIAPTDKVREMLYRYRITQPVTTIPSGLELERFAYTMTDGKRAEMRSKYGIADGEQVLIYIGRLAKEKNVDELFELLKLQSEKPVKLLLVGDGPYRETLEEHTAEMNLQDRVIFAGMVPPHLVAQYYKLGDIFVSASQSETQGLTYIEAMASGLPILCRKDKCLDGVVDNGRNGFEYTSQEDFTDYADRLLSDEVYKKQIGEAAARTVSDKFSSESFAEAVNDIYLSLLNPNEQKIV